MPSPTVSSISAAFFSATAALCALDAQRHADVLDAVQRRDQIVLLENEPDVRGAKLRDRLFVEPVQRRVEDFHFAAIDAERAGDHAQQRRFAATRRTDEHEQLAHARFEIDVLEHFGAGFALAEAFAHGVGFDGEIVHKRFQFLVTRMVLSLPERSENSPSVSYAVEDVALARRLARKLAARGHPVWLDQIKLLGGE